MNLLSRFFGRLFDRNRSAIVHGASTLRVTEYGPFLVPPTGSNCTEDRCKGEGGCATCQPVTVHLPLGAQVRSIRGLSTAGGEGGDVGLRVVPWGDHAWSYFDWPAMRTTATNLIIESRFRNRSHDRARTFSVQVEWVA